jgi:hypothetical protein
MAVLISANILPQNLTAKDKNFGLINLWIVLPFSDLEITSVALEDWMTDPDYFSPREFCESETNSRLEPWMLNLDHFVSEALLECRNEDVIEDWMVKDQHFYMPFIKFISNRSYPIEYLRGHARNLIVNR